MAMGLVLPGLSDFKSKSDLQNEVSFCLIVGVYSIIEQKNVLLPLEETQHQYTYKDFTLSLCLLQKLESQHAQPMSRKWANLNTSLNYGNLQNCVYSHQKELRTSLFAP